MNCKKCKNLTVVHDKDGNPIKLINDEERWHHCIHYKSWHLECISCRNLCTFIGFDPCYWICDGCNTRYE